MSKNINETIELIFQNRKEFILIGLTGRTGSGCSLVSKLITKKTFKEITPPIPKVGCCEDNEDRKYNIVYNYLKSNWNNFERVCISDIITSFVLEKGFDYFYRYLKINHGINDSDYEYEKDPKYNFKEEFKSLNEKIKHILEEERCNVSFSEIPTPSIEVEKYFEKINRNFDEKYNVYFSEIPKFTKIIRILFKNKFTEMYQKFGDNIRKSGCPYDENFNPEKIFCISKRTNGLIKVLRHRKSIDKNTNNVIVVIDALRNPFEVNFFKDRYSAFYLFSVNTEEEMRQKRLIGKGLNKEQIEEIDKEYIGKLKGEEQFYSLNIKSCLELADVHIYNPTEKGNNYEFLKKQIIRYITLIMHPGIIPPTDMERCMQIAHTAKLNSGCLSRQVGAAVTGTDYSVKSVGWNSAPEGHVPCILRNLQSLIDSNEKNSFSDYELYNEDFHKFIKNHENKIKDNYDKLKGRLFSYCFKDMQNAYTGDKNQVHTRSLHAEENAFLQIAKNGGMPIKGGYLFTTASPCELCAKKAYHLGISKIFYVDPYPGISKEHILNQGENRPEMVLFHGAIGRAYNQFYTQIMPYKDELSMLLDFKYKQKINNLFYGKKIIRREKKTKKK